MATFPDPNTPAQTAPVNLPNIAGRAAQTEARAQVVPAAAFYFAWHPRRFHVMQGMLVPSLRKIGFKPGTNGVDVNRAGQADPTFAVAQAEQKGWTIIPWQVDGPNTAYLYEAQGGWLSRWETLYPGAIKPEADEPGYAKWCQSLLERGIVDEPRMSVLSALADEYTELLTRSASTKIGLVPMYQARLDVVNAYMEKRQRELAAGGAIAAKPGLPEIGKRDEPEAPKPKRKRRTKAEMEAARAEGHVVVEEPTDE